MWRIQSGFLTVWDLILPKNRYKKRGQQSLLLPALT